MAHQKRFSMAPPSPILESDVSGIISDCDEEPDTQMFSNKKFVSSTPLIRGKSNENSFKSSHVNIIISSIFTSSEDSSEDENKKINRKNKDRTARGYEVKSQKINSTVTNRKGNFIQAAHDSDEGVPDYSVTPTKDKVNSIEKKRPTTVKKLTNEVAKTLPFSKTSELKTNQGSEEDARKWPLKRNSAISVQGRKNVLKGTQGKDPLLTDSDSEANERDKEEQSKIKNNIGLQNKVCATSVQDRKNELKRKQGSEEDARKWQINLKKVSATSVQGRKNVLKETQGKDSLLTDSDGEANECDKIEKSKIKNNIGLQNKVCATSIQDRKNELKRKQDSEKDARKRPIKKVSATSVQDRKNELKRKQDSEEDARKRPIKKVSATSAQDRKRELKETQGKDPLLTDSDGEANECDKIEQSKIKNNMGLQNKVCATSIQDRKNELKRKQDSEEDARKWPIKKVSATSVQDRKNELKRKQDSEEDARKRPIKKVSATSAQDRKNGKMNINQATSDGSNKLSQKTSRNSRRKTTDSEQGAANSLRRSERPKMKPLEYWRGERINYVTDSDWSRRMVGINPGFPDDTPRLSCEVGAQKKNKVQLPSIAHPNEVRRQFVNIPHENGERKLECFSSFRYGTTENENITVIIGIEMPGVSSGIIEIAPLTESARPILEDFNVVYTVIQGSVTVIVHETVKELEKGEIFCVPKGIFSSIRNCSTIRKSKLTFTRCQ